MQVKTEERIIKAYVNALKPSAEVIDNILSDINMAERKAADGVLKLALPFTALVVFIATLGFIFKDKFVTVPVLVEEAKLDKDLEALDEVNQVVGQLDELDQELGAVEQELQQLDQVLQDLQ